MSFLGDFETAVTTFLGTVATAGGGLLGIFQGAFIAGFSIWIMLIAYDVAFGKSEDGLMYLMKKIFRIFVIGVIALYGFPQLANLLIGVKDGLIVGLAGSPNIANILDVNLIMPMKNFYNTLWQWPFTGLSILDLASPITLFQKIAYYIFLWIVFVLLVVVVVVVCIVSLSMFLVALTAFSLLMAVGPFFLLCLAFPFLQRFFETYIGNVLTACLGMAFTALLVTVVGGLLNIAAIDASLTVSTDYLGFRGITVLIAAKIGEALLLTYMFFKVFDLAAALGGGLNMGNNMVAGVRNIVQDAARSSSAGTRGAAGRQGAGGNNQISQGNSRRGGQNNSRQSGGRNRGSAMQQIARNRTLTGMAVTAGALGAGAAGRGMLSVVARAVGAARRS